MAGPLLGVGNHSQENMHKRLPRYMRLAPLLCGAAFLASVAMATPAHARCTEIVATGHPDYVPITWRKGDSLEGAAVDLLQLVGHKLKIPVRVVHTGSWKRAQAEVFAGDVDLVLGIYKNSRREQLLNYTSAYASEPVVVVTLSDTELHYRERQDLKPYQGGMVIGDSFGEELDAFTKSSLKVHLVPSVEHLLNLLDRKRIQYALHGLYPVLVTGHKLGMAPRMRTLVPPLAQESMYMAVSKRSACRNLVPAISAEIEKMRISGTVDRLLGDSWDQWSKFDNVGIAPPTLPDGAPDDTGQQGGDQSD